MNKNNYHNYKVHVVTQVKLLTGSYLKQQTGPDLTFLFDDLGCFFPVLQSFNLGFVFYCVSHFLHQL